MRHHKIGSLDASVIGLGCNNFGRKLDAAGTARVLDAAIDAGINFLDTANVYGGGGVSESHMGAALRGRRQQVLIATKFGMKMPDGRQGGHPAYVKEAVAESLKRLQIEHIDLYQLHRPDDSVPIADTLGALGELVQEGVVREIGCSNFSAEQMEEATAAVGDGAPRFVSVQNEYSMLERKAEATELPAAERLGIAFIPFFPLASGLLSGKYRLGQEPPHDGRLVGHARQEELLSEERLRLVEQLRGFAEDNGKELIDLAFAYLLAHPAVASVIAGATSPEQVRRNADTADWALSAEQLAEVRGILEGQA